MRKVWIKDGVVFTPPPDGEYIIFSRRGLDRLAAELRALNSWEDVLAGLEEPRLLTLNQKALLYALALNGGDKRTAAAWLGISYQSLIRRLRDFKNK